MSCLGRCRSFVLRGTGITGLSLRWTRPTSILAFHDVRAYESPFLGADRSIGDELEKHTDQFGFYFKGCLMMSCCDVHGGVNVGGPEL
jgi:hypothetical protein